MTSHLSRRDFMAATAAGGALLWPATLRAATGATPPITLRARPFPLDRVRLRPGYVADQLEINRRHLLAQDPDRLLHMFRVTAGLPSSAEPLGGWEAPDNELRGHYTGHYLSACALLFAATGDAAIRSRAETVVAGLAECQRALGSGYLSAFPEELFDRLRAGQPAWAPFYTIHKLMAGLLDQHQLAGSAPAREVLERQARWVGRWCQPLGDAHMARVLEREYGGMNEVLYNLHALTGDAQHLALAQRFDHERFFAPLAQGRDELAGLHANTSIPKVIGAARRHELLGERRARDIAEYFWHEVTGRRCYATGGTSADEGWGELGALAAGLSGYTQECCVTYNMLKLSRHLFSWTADPRVADYYERAYLNGILGTMHPSDGDKLYYVSLADGLWKLFGTPGHDYWCCTGSMAESFAKLGDSIYFGDDAGLYVNLFVASELDWRERDVRILQETRFPEEETTRLTVRAPRPASFALRVRVPGWAAGGHATLNGRRLESFAAPGSYLVVERRWQDGDRLEVTLPMTLRAEPLPDAPARHALCFGPLVLVGRLGTEGLTPQSLRAEPTAPRTVPEYRLPSVPAPTLVGKADALGTWIRPVAGRPLTFTTSGQPIDLELVPFYRSLDERYAVYWTIAEA